MPDYSEQESFHTPSAVYISPEGAFVGRAAESLLEQRPEIAGNVIRFFKRSLGKKEPIWLDGKNNAWYPEAIAALVLRKLKFDAESSVADKVDGAVITVPAHFNDLQRQAVRHAAMLADMPLLSIVDEPVAAALHYGISHNQNDRIMLAYDFGGGTFDATVMTLNKGGIQVLSANGVTELGGKEVDEKIMEMLFSQFEVVTGRQIQLTGRIPFDARRAAEDIKIELSLPGHKLVARNVLLGDEYFEFVITRDEFSRTIAGLLDRTMDETLKCVRDASLSPSAIDTVLLVGGSSMLPQVEERIRKVFAGKQEILFYEPSKAVALGAAISAAQASGDAKLYDLPETMRGVSAYSVGVRTLDPRSGRLLIDTLIKKNSSLPVIVRKRYYTARADQERILLEIMQYRNGEEPTSLGQLIVGPLASPRLNYSVDVTLENREDGTVAVEAFDADTNVALKSEFSRDDNKALAKLASQRELVRSTVINAV
jgi:molecular chaperone DnaK